MNRSVLLGLVAWTCAVSVALAFTPQPAILSDLQHSANGVTIFLSGAVSGSAALQAHVRSVCAQFPTMVSNVQAFPDGASMTASLGFSYEAWAYLGAPKYAQPPGSMGFPGYMGNGVSMTSSGGDLFVHAKAEYRDALYHLADQFVTALGTQVVANVTVVESWRNYLDQENRDLTGFIDGTVNCPVNLKAEMGLIDDPVFGAGSYLLAQKWIHNLAAFNQLPLAEQEAVFGRTKADSQALPNAPPTSHVARVKQSAFGFFVVRQAIPFGNVATGEHGLQFLVYANTTSHLDLMLRSMVGQATYATPAGDVDAVMHYSNPVWNNYYFMPSMEILQSLASF